MLHEELIRVYTALGGGIVDLTGNKAAMRFDPLHLIAKWFFLLRLKHVFPNAGHNSLLGSCRSAHALHSQSLCADGFFIGLIDSVHFLGSQDFGL